MVVTTDDGLELLYVDLKIVALRVKQVLATVGGDNCALDRIVGKFVCNPSACHSSEQRRLCSVIQ